MATLLFAVLWRRSFISAFSGEFQKALVGEADQGGERSDRPLALDNLDGPHNIQNLAPVPRDERARALDVRRKSLLVVHWRHALRDQNYRGRETQFNSS
jgi:hypothetical protein